MNIYFALSAITVRVTVLPVKSQAFGGGRSRKMKIARRVTMNVTMPRGAEKSGDKRMIRNAAPIAIGGSVKT